MWILSLLLAIPFGRVLAQTPPTEPFTPEELAIYHRLLQHYPLHQADLLNMSPQTMPFAPFQGPDGAPSRSELREIKVIPPAITSRNLPQSLLAFGDQQRIKQVLAAEGQLVPANRRGKNRRLDGLVKTQFRLSEIAFDVDHHYAEVVFEASCGCLGGEGGTALFKRRGKRWKLLRIADEWVG